METQTVQNFLTSIDRVIENFENEKIDGKDLNRNIGIIYTPKIVVDYIVFNIFRIYFEELIDISKLVENNTYRKTFIKNKELYSALIKKIHDIRILDPACGSGRFLISVADNLYQLYRLLNTKLSVFEIKRNIIEENLHGVEIEKPACIVSKLRLIKWLYHNNEIHFKIKNSNINLLKVINYDQFFKQLNLQFNIYNVDFLLEFNSSNYDIIIGNPPYIENKKIKDIQYKKKLTKRFKSAYRLFDISVVFLEKALELLKENSGCLSMITTNKFFSADYGIRIRQLLINETELKEFINISSIPIFKKTAAYPIIISFKKSPPNNNNLILIKHYKNMNDLFEKNNVKTKKMPQQLIKQIPGSVFPIFGDINLIKYLYSNFKPFSNIVPDLKIIYRPFGFINWAKHLENLSNTKNSDEDLLLIGTGSVGKYYIKFDKPIRIAKKKFNISFFKFHEKYNKIWKELKSEKLIFREIAKELTCVYDIGLFTNVTGLYFIRIPSFNEEKLFCLLTILNSKLMDLVFKTLFGSLHMASGYLRFNGSFVKRLPIPKKLPRSLSQIGKLLQILSHLQYDLNTVRQGSFNSLDLSFFKEKDWIDIGLYLNFFKKLNDSLVKLLYLENYYLKSHKNFKQLRDLLYSKRFHLETPFKFILPRFHIPKYKTFNLKELESILVKIKNFYNTLIKNKILMDEINEIIKNNLI